MMDAVWARVKKIRLMHVAQMINCQIIAMIFVAGRQCGGEWTDITTVRDN